MLAIDAVIDGPGVLVAGLSTMYDINVIDTSPVLAALDTQVIAPLAGSIFWLARAEVTTQAEW